MLLVGRVEALVPGGRLRSLERRRAREDRVLDEVTQIIWPYAAHGITVVSDQHQGDSIRSHFGRHGWGVTIENLTAPKQTAAFTSTRARLVDGSLRLWKCPQLLEDLRRVRARDTETIALPHYAGGHADAASALALAVYQLRGVTDTPPYRRTSGPVGDPPITAGVQSFDKPRHLDAASCSPGPRHAHRPASTAGRRLVREAVLMDRPTWDGDWTRTAFLTMLAELEAQGVRGPRGRLRFAA